MFTSNSWYTNGPYLTRGNRTSKYTQKAYTHSLSFFTVSNRMFSETIIIFMFKSDWDQWISLYSFRFWNICRQVLDSTFYSLSFWFDKAIIITDGFCASACSYFGMFCSFVMFLCITLLITLHWSFFLIQFSFLHCVFGFSSKFLSFLSCIIDSYYLFSLSNEDANHR